MVQAILAPPASRASPHRPTYPPAQSGRISKARQAIPLGYKSSLLGDCRPTCDIRRFGLIVGSPEGPAVPNSRPYPWSVLLKTGPRRAGQSYSVYCLLKNF